MVYTGAGQHAGAGQHTGAGQHAGAQHRRRWQPASASQVVANAATQVMAPTNRMITLPVIVETLEDPRDSKQSGSPRGPPSRGRGTVGRDVFRGQLRAAQDETAPGIIRRTVPRIRGVIGRRSLATGLATWMALVRPGSLQRSPVSPWFPRSSGSSGSVTVSGEAWWLETSGARSPAASRRGWQGFRSSVLPGDQGSRCPCEVTRTGWAGGGAVDWFTSR